LFDLPDCDYQSADEVRYACQNSVSNDNHADRPWYIPSTLPVADDTVTRITEWSMYAVDNLVRRAPALQAAASNKAPAIIVNSKLARVYNFRGGKTAQAKQVEQEVTLPIIIDDRIADNNVLLRAGTVEATGLGDPFGMIDLK